MSEIIVSWLVDRRRNFAGKVAQFMFENEMKMAVMLAQYGAIKTEMTHPYMGLKTSLFFLFAW